MDPDFIMHFVRSQFIFIGKFYKQIDFEQHFLKSYDILSRIETEAVKTLEFIKTYSSYPFIIDASEHDIKGTLEVKNLINFIQDIVLAY